MHLLDHLMAEYLKSVANEGLMSRPIINQFIEFSKAYLAKNPIVSTAIVDVGVGLRFQTGEVVSLVEPVKDTRPNVAISISDTAVNPATHGITDTRAVNITDPNK